MINMANIELMYNTFRIIGPPELAILTSTTIQQMDGRDSEDIQNAVYDIWKNWYVKCSVSGELVNLRDLRYWDVPKQEVYARPELVPDIYKA